MKNISVIIPSLDPNEHLGDVVTSLIEKGFTDIILIDDGSKEENKKYFPTGEHITLLTHETNIGKGAALKTALRYVMQNRPSCIGVVTCDSDGQHLADDVFYVADEMKKTDNYVLGVRDFSLDDVPPKSRFGNRISAAFLALCCGHYICDTQTGLRAIPKKLLLPMSLVEGDRFEYETNVLLELRSMKAGLSQVKIQTVYLNENKGTHFHPIKDSIRIFSRILKYLLSSASAFITDIFLFWLMTSIFSVGVIISTAIARVFSSVLNFFLNKKMVFKSNEPLLKSLFKYYLLAIPVMLISAFGVKYIALFLSVPENSFLVTVIKLICDFLLFILNYSIQKTWIFKK